MIFVPNMAVLLLWMFLVLWEQHCAMAIMLMFWWEVLANGNWLMREAAGLFLQNTKKNGARWRKKWMFWKMKSHSRKYGKNYKNYRNESASCRNGGIKFLRISAILIFFIQRISVLWW